METDEQSPAVAKTYSMGFKVQLPEDPEERRKAIKEIEAMVAAMNRWPGHIGD